MIVTFAGSTPRIAPSAYVHSTAQVIGNVEIGAECSVWFNSVIRGDVNYIRIGKRTNIQDNSTVHVTGGRWPTRVGDDVTVGHGVILHGCTVGDRCLVGIGAILLDGCEIGSHCIIGAGALVTPGTKIPAGRMALGNPARVVRPLEEEELESLRESARRYVAHAQHYHSLGIA